MTRSCVLFFLIVSFCLAVRAQTAPTPTDFQCFGADTFATGLNDAGQVVGWYGAFESGHSFVRDRNGACQAIPDVPGSTATIAFGINDAGLIVGIYFPGKEGFGSAFIFDKGVHTTFDHPAQELQDVCQTFAFSINNRGQIVGFYDLWRSDPADGMVCDGPDRPFVRQSDGSFIPLAAPAGSTDSVQVNAVNARGMMIGNYLAGTNEFGFLRLADGTTVLIHPEGAEDTMPSGINPQGHVVGRYFHESALGPIGPCHSFFMDTNGAIVELTYPGAVYTCVGGINASGEVSGTWGNAVNGPWHAFVADLKALLPPSP